MYHETYDDYIRSILGYSPMDSLNDDLQDYRNSNINYNMYWEMNNHTNMDLERCYPEIYRIVYPMITTKCDTIKTPLTDREIEDITDEIYNALESRNDTRTIETSNINKTVVSNKRAEVKNSELKNESRETRQINGDLRDLIQILLITELLNRRRKPPVPPRPPMPGPRPPIRRQFY